MNFTFLNKAAVIGLIIATIFAESSNVNAEVPNLARRCETTLSIEEFKALALNNSPIISEIDEEYAAELKAAFEIEVLNNPELQIEQVYTNEALNGDNDDQSNVSLGQPLRLSNFGSRSKLSTTIRNLGDVDKKIKLLQFTQKLELNFYSLFMLQETVGIMKDSEDRASKKLSVIKEGVKKGQLSLGDEKIFEGEKFRLIAEAKGIEAEIELLQAELMRLLGMNCHIALTVKPKLNQIPTSEVLIERALSNGLSEVSRNKILNDLIDDQIEVAKLDMFPQITPRLAYQHTNDGGDFFGVGVAIPLPLWDRNQGELLKLNAAKTTITKKTGFLDKGGLESQIRTLRVAAVTSAEQYEIFTGKVVPSFEQALASQESLYLRGQGNVVQVWQSLRVLNESQLKSLSSLIQAASARIKLSIIVGEEI